MTLNCTPATHQVVVSVELPSQSACFLGVHCRSALSIIQLWEGRKGGGGGKVSCTVHGDKIRLFTNQAKFSVWFYLSSIQYCKTEVSTILNCLVKVKKTTAKTVYDQSCSTSDPKWSWSVIIDQTENVTVKKTFAGTDQTTWNRVKLPYFDWPIYRDIYGVK